MCRTKNTHNRSVTEIALAAELYEQHNYTLNTISYLLDRSPSTIGKWLRSFDIPLRSRGSKKGDNVRIYCPQGHLYIFKNKRGHNICKTCWRANQKKYRCNKPVKPFFRLQHGSI